MLVGLGLDLVVHTVFPAGPVISGFSIQQHGAHFVVLIGMVLVLAAIVIDGRRHAAGRSARPEGRPRDAVR